MSNDQIRVEGGGAGREEGSSSRSSTTLLIEPSDDHHHQLPPPQLSRYESQKRRDWNTFGQYLKNQSPPIPLSQCNYNHVLEFLRYLDQFGKTKIHIHSCPFFGQPELSGAFLDALIGRLRAAYEENGGLPENNPFASGAIRVYLREVRDFQAKARGISYKKKKKKRKIQNKAISTTVEATTTFQFQSS
ncbi:unnamed protein product [Withania somnifera]